MQPHLEGTGEVDGEGGTARVDGDGLRVGGRVHAAVEVVRGHRRHRGIAVEPLVQLRDQTTEGGQLQRQNQGSPSTAIFLQPERPETAQLLARAKSDPVPPRVRPATPSRPRRAPADPMSQRGRPSHSPAGVPAPKPRAVCSGFRAQTLVPRRTLAAENTSNVTRLGFDSRNDGLNVSRVDIGRIWREQCRSGPGNAGIWWRRRGRVPARGRSRGATRCGKATKCRQ